MQGDDLKLLLEQYVEQENGWDGGGHRQGCPA